MFEKQYEKTWKRLGFKSRAVKYKINEPLPLDIINEKSNIVSRLVFNDLKSGELSTDEIKKKGRAGYMVADAFAKKYRDILGLKSTAWEKTIVRPVLERYRSYIKRNRRRKRNIPKNVIKFRFNKAYRIGDHILRDKGDYLQFKLPKEERKYLDIKDFEICGSMKKYRDFVTNGGGGNYIDGIFIARAKIEFDWLYKPQSIVSIDINKRNDVFIVIGDGEGNKIDIIEHSEEIIKLIAELKKLNDEISNFNKSNSNTKVRRRRRKRWFNVHDKIKREVFKKDGPIEKIIKITKERNALLCIDSVAPANVSFGQDKIIAGLISTCENRRIPHVLVDSWYTTRMCQCGKIVERPEIEYIECEKCGKIDADINATHNIGRFGKYIWEHGNSRFNKWINAKIKLAHNV